MYDMCINSSLKGQNRYGEKVLLRYNISSPSLYIVPTCLGVYIYRYIIIKIHNFYHPYIAFLKAYTKSRH